MHATCTVIKKGHSHSHVVTGSKMSKEEDALDVVVPSSVQNGGVEGLAFIVVEVDLLPMPTLRTEVKCAK